MFNKLNSSTTYIRGITNKSAIIGKDRNTYDMFLHKQKKKKTKTSFKIG